MEFKFFYTKYLYINYRNISGHVSLRLGLGYLVDIHFMDLLIGAIFGQQLKLNVERNTGVVWFEFRGVC